MLRSIENGFRRFFFFSFLEYKKEVVSDSSEVEVIIDVQGIFVFLKGFTIYFISFFGVQITENGHFR